MWNEIVQNWKDTHQLNHLSHSFYIYKMSESVINAPKGLLRLIILDQSSRNPISGTEIIKYIELITNNEWSPSPGSVYLILKNLLAQEYLTEIYLPDNTHKKYGATSKGKSMMIIEKEKLEKTWRTNIYYIKIMAELLNIHESEFLNIIKSHLLNSKHI